MTSRRCDGLSVVASLPQGYALVEYERKEEAENAIAGMNGKPLLGQAVSVDWAFTKGACKKEFSCC